MDISVTTVSFLSSYVFVTVADILLKCIEQIWYREWYMTWKDKPRPFVMWEWKIIFGYKNYHIGRCGYKNSHFSITTLAKHIRIRNSNLNPGSLLSNLILQNNQCWYLCNLENLTRISQCELPGKATVMMSY